MACWQGATSRVTGAYFADGTQQTLIFRVPMFFLGHVIVSLRIPASASEPGAATLHSVTLYNAPSARRVLERNTFVEDESGRLSSVNVHLA